MEENSLENKNIVITGASSGLGKALAESLSTEGAHLFLLSRSIESVDISFPATKINCDFKDSTSIISAFQQIGDIDALINCVGIGLVKNLEDTTEQEIQDLITTNLTGTIMASQQAYKEMIPKKSGHIINVGSTSSVKTRPYETIYCASKWGLRGFTESLRMAAVDRKIRVTGIYPGGMKTDFWKIKPDQVTDGYMDPKDIAEQIVHILKSPISVAPSEYLIERGF